MSDFFDLLKSQHLFFESGQTKSYDFRLSALTDLENALIHRERLILAALKKDLNKAPFESYATEFGVVLDEIKYAKKHLKKWMSPQRRSVGLKNFPAQGRIYREPYGSALIMAPWNYPFQLLINPLVASIAAGNCTVLKASEDAPATSQVIKTLIECIFKPDYVAVILGDVSVSKQLLTHQFDLIFFTGSSSVGKMVMKAASEFLTPVTLELGGKSPCIIDETAQLSLAAKRIVWGKFLNAGQTCVAPDYLLVHESVSAQLITVLKEHIQAMYHKALSNPDYPSVINDGHFKRLTQLIRNENVIFGGDFDAPSKKIEPTLIFTDNWESPIMQEEIFGPLLPILTYSSKEDLVKKLNQKEKPLATYLFTTSKVNETYFLNALSFGGGCINDTVVHVASPTLPFGGVGNSGMGAYHGEKGFDTFSHAKSILKKSNLIDFPFRYPPYKEKWFKLLKKL